MKVLFRTGASLRSKQPPRLGRGAWRRRVTPQLKLARGFGNYTLQNGSVSTSLDRRTKTIDRSVRYRLTSSLLSPIWFHFRSSIINSRRSFSVKVEQQARVSRKPKFGDWMSDGDTNVALYVGVTRIPNTQSCICPSVNIKRLSTINSKVHRGSVTELHRSALRVRRSAAQSCCRELSLDEGDCRSANPYVEGARLVGVIADNIDVRLNAPDFQLRGPYHASLQLHKGISGISTTHCKVLPNAGLKLQARWYSSRPYQ